MSDIEDDFEEAFTKYQENKNFTGNDGGNSTDPSGGTKKAKLVRFGVVELVAFIAVWVLIVIGYKAHIRYRNRGQKRKGWFGVHAEKEAYQQLLFSDPDNEEGLRRALLRRAMTDVKRLWSLNEERESLQALNKAGAISEEMWSDFKQAEKDIELELFDLQAESETFKEGWSEEILRDAARLAKVEEELSEMKKAKDRAEKQKRDDESNKVASRGGSSTKVKPPASPVKVVDEMERIRLITELLAEEEAKKKATAASASKRVVSPPQSRKKSK